MVTPWQQPEVKSNPAENVIRDYMEKMTLALETESAKLKEQAEREAEEIIAKAREEADNILAQARQDSREESEHIMDQLKRDAERLLQESREQASRESQEIADGIIQEAKEKAAGMLGEVIERGINKIEYDFILAVSSAKRVLEDEKSRLSPDIDKEVIIVEKETAEADDMENVLTLDDDSEDDQPVEQEPQETPVSP